MIDYKGFIENNFQIKNKSGEIVPFIFNETQDYYYSMMVEEYGEELQGVRENILKFRQPGFSSLIDAMFTVDFIFSEWGKIPIIDSDIVSAREKDTIVLFNRISSFLDSFFVKWGIVRKDFLEIDSTTLIKGKRGAQMYVQTASAKVSGRGGALDDDTLVATINGFKRHGDLAIGDIIFDKYGKETKVIGTYPQGILDMYRVKLSTGVYLDAELNHLWEIRKNRKKEFVVSTQEIIDRFKDGFKTKIYGGDAISYSEKKLLIEPYSLGVILGDGYICKDKYHKGYVSIITPELETLEKMEKGLISKFERDIYKMSMYRYHNKNFKNGLVEYGLIYIKSHTKFIPKDYLESSIDQRKSLLAGLLNTDGYMDQTSNRIEYSTVSKQLADDVCLLVKSLGGNCHIGIAKKENHKGKIKLRHDLYRLNILVRFNPFTLTRKAVKWQEPQNKEWFRVVSVEKLNPKSCQCISVDSPTHTYRGGIGYMVTHNTKQNIHWCLSGNQLVIKRNGWVEKIQDIKSGDVIYDGNGNLIKVHSLSVKEPPEKLKSIKLWGNTPFPIEGTLSHKLLCMGNDGNPVFKKISEISKEDYVAFPKPRQILKKIKVSNPIIEPTIDWGEFCGWYLAEGWIMNKNINGVGIACHSDEVDYLTNLFNRLGLKFGYSQRTTNGACFEISNSVLARKILKLFGSKDEKHIDDSIFRYGKQFVIGLLKGLFLGDGCFKVRGIVTLVSTRLQLIVQVKKLIIALRLGYPSIIDHGKSKIPNAKQAFILALTGNTAVKFRKLIKVESEYRLDYRKIGYSKYFKKFGNYYYAKVKTIVDIDSPPLVYDVCLDKNPHSFCLISGVSKNSEVAFYPNTEILNANTLVLGAEQQVMDGVGKIFRETTGNTDVDFFAEEYFRGVEGLSDFKSRFLGWWLHKGYSKIPPVDWIMPTEYRKLHDIYGTTVEQCYWHWYKIEHAKDKALMKREYPIDETEAFIGDGTQYFDIFLTNFYMDLIKKPISNSLIYV